MLACENPEWQLEHLPYAGQVSMIQVERAISGTENSVYDRFMFELVGHPLEEDLKPVTFPDVNGNDVVYPHRTVRLVTQSAVVVLRSTVPYPTLPEEMLVVYADLEHQVHGALRVANIIRANDSTRAQELILADPTYATQCEDSVRVPVNQNIGPLRVITDSWRQAKARAEQQDDYPRLVLGTQMAGFQKPGGQFEMYEGSIADLHRALKADEESAHKTLNHATMAA